MTCQAEASGFESEYFSIDTAPVLIPEGPWTEIPGSVMAPKGFKGNGMYSKMRAGAKGDLAVVACDAGAVAAGAFTQNVMCAAPVTVCKKVLANNSSSIKAVRFVYRPRIHSATVTKMQRRTCSVPQILNLLDASSYSVTRRVDQFVAPVWYLAILLKHALLVPRSG